MERKIGEEFEYNGVRLKVVEENGCDKCYFRHLKYYPGACSSSEHYNIHGCCNISRNDRKSVQFIKVEDMKEQETKSLPIPEGWEFAGYENGEVKIRRVEPKLPTTYEDAVDAINYDILTRMLVPQNMSRPVIALCNLLVCRNAWWQKLGWKPDWKEHDGKFVIRPKYDNVECSTNATANRILAFPTEEVRDKFAETFRDLIEEAKELL